MTAVVIAQRSANFEVRAVIRVLRGPGSSSDKALGFGLDGPGSIPGVHPFVSRLVLGSTQPPIN